MSLPIPQEKKILAAPHVCQVGPSAVTGCKPLAHDETETTIVLRSTQDLRRQRQKLLVNQTSGIEVRQQTGTSLEENFISNSEPLYGSQNQCRFDGRTTAL
jgi:hypothetical protein